MYLLFDIGGTKTRIATSNGESFDNFKVYDTPQNYPQLLDILNSYFLKTDRSQASLILDSPPKAVCGGVAGTFDPTRSYLIDAPHLPNFVHQPLKQDLESALHCPVYLLNDAQLAALGEARLGAGKGYGSIGFITIGTGVGGTRVIEGHLDPNFANFEPGHQIYSGNQTLEAQISGSALAEKYHQHPEQINDPKIWDQVATDLSTALKKLSIIWSPELFILGGSVSHQIPLTKLPQNPPVKLGALGDKAGVYGALEYLKQSY